MGVCCLCQCRNSHVCPQPCYVHVRVLAQLAEITEMPTLILHGSADKLVPPDQATMAFESSGSSRKTLKLIEGAGHNDIGMAQEYWETLSAFFDETIGKS